MLTVLERILDRREGCDDALCEWDVSGKLGDVERTHCGICNLALLVEGNVEVNADEYALSFEVEIGDGELVAEGHGVRLRCDSKSAYARVYLLLSPDGQLARP